MSGSSATRSARSSEQTGPALFETEEYFRQTFFDVAPRVFERLAAAAEPRSATGSRAPRC